MTDTVRAWRAPGRVNLIGGQVDWHEGLVVSMAIDRGVRITRRLRTDDRVTARSSAFPEPVDLAADGSDAPAMVAPAWGRTVAGAVRVLADLDKRAAAADLEIASDLPVGAGLSSSAALSVACLLALAEPDRSAPTGVDLARAAVAVEHAASGVPCGMQDPMAVVHGRPDHALLIDCRTDAVTPIPWPDRLAVVVVHSGVPRHLAATPFAEYRADSLAVAAKIGVRALRDATPEQVADHPRGRHAVSEIARVQHFADALASGDLDALGPLMDASHASSRDDMGVSTPELDDLVAALRHHGARGARLTGAGFGGCVVALVDAERAASVANATVRDARAATGRDLQWWTVRPSGGAAVEG